MITPGSDLYACAQIVERGDPERFAAAMAAPPEARSVLFPLYAFNVEVSRAPWVTAEPMIAEMRLQWWRDVLEEIGAGGPVRRHEVATPLAEALRGQDVAWLDALVAARRLDLEHAPFADDAALLGYLDATAGALATAAARALGTPEAAMPGVARWARAAGLARYFQAVPELEARGKLPLPDGRPAAIAALAREALEGLDAAGPLRRLRRRAGPGGAALREAWQAQPLLRRVLRDPECVAEGRLALPEITRRWRLLVS